MALENRRCSRLWPGFCLPAAGSVSMDGVEIAAMRPQARARKLAFVPSTPPRGTVLTVQDVIELALEAGGHQADATKCGAIDAARRGSSMGATSH